MVSKTQKLIAGALRAAETGKMPDSAIRLGIRQLLRSRLRATRKEFEGHGAVDLERFAEGLKGRPVAESTEEANEQHYEVPAKFFETILGPRKKYSSCYWDHPTDNLATAEESMLELTCQRANILDGQDILELGCGWGSLTLWMAERYPKARIQALSNSHSQIQSIQQALVRRGLTNVELIKVDVNTFTTAKRFDRIVSVEMFEHMRNYDVLFNNMTSWLKSEGKLFVHVFSHRDYPYLFETEGAANWMGRYFFTGGTMPSHDLLPYFKGTLELEDQWRVNGVHYAMTLEAWLRKLDAHRAELRPLFNNVYGYELANIWIQRWRMFLMACAELFAFREGEEWGISHYLFAKQASAVS